MAIESDSPQLKALLQDVEQLFGHPVKTPSDFVLVADRIERKTGEHISDSTIKRLWIPKLGYRTVSERTLNVLASYVGYGHFKAYCEALRSKGKLSESEIVDGEASVRTSSLKCGDRIRIAWLPDRECTLEYLGDRKFKVIESLNATIRIGDTFFCDVFYKGRSLYVDSLCHNGEMFDGYCMGMDHGLTRLEVL